MTVKIKKKTKTLWKINLMQVTILFPHFHYFIELWKKLYVVQSG